MLNMSRKNGATPPREGTAAAAREAAQSGATPGPATAERPVRRTFPAEYKLRILREADVAAASGEAGAIGGAPRREGGGGAPDVPGRVQAAHLARGRCRRGVRRGGSHRRAAAARGCEGLWSSHL